MRSGSVIRRYSPEQLYAVVAAVDLYEDFVPWCQKSSVIWRKDNVALEAELEIGFKFFVERYISHVEMKKPHLIKVSPPFQRFCPAVMVWIHDVLLVIFLRTWPSAFLLNPANQTLL